MKRAAVLFAILAFLGVADEARAQGVTTGAMTGVVTNDQQQPVYLREPRMRRRRGRMDGLRFQA